MTKQIEVAGVGCCLVDYLFNNITFTSEAFSRYSSKKSGDGGLTPGQLVFAEEFEKFSNQDLELAIQEITHGKPPDKVNIGGPGIVALIHAAQMLENTSCQVRFYGGRGEDEAGEYLQSSLAKTPVNTDNYKRVNGATPSTVVLSDPGFHEGTGERIFINSIGAAGNYLPGYLDDRFFASDVVVFGGTALVPVIHDNLTELLTRAKANGCVTVVNTVYDFRNQKANPHKKWPLGKSDESYRNIDLLITNHEEALRLSGKSKLKEAMEFFQKVGTGAVLVTNGAKNITLSAGESSIFRGTKPTEMPVSEAISKELNKGGSGDTTGCGDNFAGGVIASLVMQLQNGSTKINLKEAATWGIVSGGFSCFYMGGTFHQKEPGEKRQQITPYYEAYLKQIDER
ncbi:MAG TPA: carbohydrate kinase family protein [Mariniphaga anaerophila]|uniref:Carbohydrate kinase family protein n=1 Tax=Mariniphaga anaerophila TaxID=1484053 RepID=A0A831LKE0_9BACT|nr:carbohydrate kinase family protein [Mariniphaga anaerophila]